jgi:hypothetical protein
VQYLHHSLRYRVSGIVSSPKGRSVDFASEAVFSGIGAGETSGWESFNVGVPTISGSVGGNSEFGSEPLVAGD